MINQILIGALTMSCFTASLFFLKFWKETKDRFFLFFSLSFLFEGLTRIVLWLNYYSDEQEPLFYLARLVAFLLIVFAVIDKNIHASTETKIRFKRQH